MVEVVNEIQIVKNEANTIISLENMIRNTIKGLDKVKESKRTMKQMFDDGFNNNPAYREKAKEAKEKNNEKNAIKLQLLKKPDMAKLNGDLKAMTGEIREKKQKLSSYLVDYYAKTQASQLELFEGETLQIVTEAKAVRSLKKKFKKNK